MTSDQQGTDPALHHTVIWKCFLYPSPVEPVVIPSGNRGKHFRHSMADTWEELGGAKGEETAIRIYYIRKKIYFQ